MTFHAFLKDDEFVKSPKGLFSVIPAQAGIQSFSVLGIPLDSPACRQAGVFTRMTTFYETIKDSFLSRQKGGLMLNKRPIHAFIPFLSILLSYGLALGEAKPVGFSVPFPDLIFTQSLSREEQHYLGLSPKKVFSFREISGNLILVEFLSTYCVSCQRQAPIFNEVYSLIESNPRLRGKVKMVGIAAGNNIQEVQIFKKAYNIPHPILSDAKFDAHTAVGSPRTPFSIWVRRDAQGNSIVVSTHLGLIASVKSALDETRAVLQYNLALLKPKKGAIYDGEALKPPISEEELVSKAKAGMEASGGKVLRIEKLSLKDGDSIYVGNVDFGTHQKHLFSKLASRRAACDICHDTYFIYTFDPEGRVIDIVPIQLTKIDNLNWTEEDIKKLKSRTIGKSILKPFPFDPTVDSVSGATITAALIFDSLDKAKAIFEKLKKEGYVK
jgi:thiol-disulfide isomerase/thioredoxin